MSAKRRYTSTNRRQTLSHELADVVTTTDTFTPASMTTATLPPLFGERAGNMEYPAARPQLPPLFNIATHARNSLIATSSLSPQSAGPGGMLHAPTQPSTGSKPQGPPFAPMSNFPHSQEPPITPSKPGHTALHGIAATDSHSWPQQQAARKRSYLEMQQPRKRIDSDPPIHPTHSGQNKVNAVQTRLNSPYSSFRYESHSKESPRKPARGHRSIPQSQTSTRTSGDSSSHTARCSILVRQQPRAARAGPDGKDRRSIDPPPVIQLMMNDFDANNEQDVAELKSQSWVVHAKLVSAESPKEDVTVVSESHELGSSESITRLLLGTSVSSPFFCNDDPDAANMPQHPVTRAASPTSRFIQRTRTGGNTPATPNSLPGAFFIFADLSVRKAGEYRLEFSLMRMSPSNLITGSIVPILASVTTSVFRAVNAKDFDQVQPSSKLVKGLISRGAGFPLKLKKGFREGQKRRDTQDDAHTEEGDQDHDSSDEDEHG